MRQTWTATATWMSCPRSYSDDKIAWYENDGSLVFTERIISTTADRAAFGVRGGRGRRWGRGRPVGLAGR